MRNVRGLVLPFSPADVRAAEQAARRIEGAKAAELRRRTLTFELIDSEDGRVKMQFSRPIEAFSLTPDDALALSEKIAAVAAAVRERAAAALLATPTPAQLGKTEEEESSI